MTNDILVCDLDFCSVFILKKYINNLGFTKAKAMILKLNSQSNEVYQPIAGINIGRIEGCQK